MIRAILGLVALLGFAYVGGHPRLQNIERNLGMSRWVTAGVPFVILGAIAPGGRPPA